MLGGCILPIQDVANAWRWVGTVPSARRLPQVGQCGPAGSCHSGGSPFAHSSGDDCEEARSSNLGRGPPLLLASRSKEAPESLLVCSLFRPAWPGVLACPRARSARPSSPRAPGPGVGGSLAPGAWGFLARVPSPRLGVGPGGSVSGLGPSPSGAAEPSCHRSGLGASWASWSVSLVLLRLARLLAGLLPL